jgi:hypothetical protein
MGIEPTPQAWEARILPLNYTRKGLIRDQRAIPVKVLGEVEEKSAIQPINMTA